MGFEWYAVSLAGPTHVERGLPCQDAYSVSMCSDFVVVAVADGLGSERHSDVGARIATQAAAEYVMGRLQSRYSDPCDVIQAAFRSAYYAVLDAAGDDAGQYDCTLVVCVWDGKTLWWGQAGDSGAVACRGDGSYLPVTRMARDEEGRVYPLCFEDKYEFGRLDDVASFLVCTDGILEKIAPPILEKYSLEPVDTQFAHPLLHPADGRKRPRSVKALQRDAVEFFSGIPKEELDDDKTVVVVYDEKRLPKRREDAYYEGPDWDKVNARASRMLYAAHDDALSAGDGGRDVAGSVAGLSTPRSRAGNAAAESARSRTFGELMSTNVELPLVCIIAMAAIELVMILVLLYVAFHIMP